MADEKEELIFSTFGGDVMNLKVAFDEEETKISETMNLILFGYWFHLWSYLYCTQLVVVVRLTS